jgi:hypothetical protein
MKLEISEQKKKKKIKISDFMKIRLVAANSCSVRTDVQTGVQTDGQI